MPFLPPGLPATCPHPDGLGQPQLWAPTAPYMLLTPAGREVIRCRGGSGADGGLNGPGSGGGGDCFPSNGGFCPLPFTWIWISSVSSLARPSSCPAVGSRALTTTLSPVRPFTRPCTFMAKLYCAGSRSEAWDRHQTRSQGGAGAPVPPTAAHLSSKAAASPLRPGPANPSNHAAYSHARFTDAGGSTQLGRPSQDL